MIPKDKRETNLAQHPAVAAARKAGVPVILCGLCGDSVDDMCERATAQALQMEKAALDTALCADSFYLDMWKNLFSYPAAISSFWGAMTQGWEACLELQMHWLGLLTPHTEGEVGGTLETMPPATKREEEEMEKGIDTAVEAFEEEILA